MSRHTHLNLMYEILITFCSDQQTKPRRTRLQTTLPQSTHFGYKYGKWILGYDRCAKKYKVVGLATDEREDDDPITKLIVFTVGDPEASGWRTFGFQIPRPSVTAVGEKSIWLLSQRLREDKYHLFSLDLNNDMIRFISFLSMRMRCWPWFMYELKGHLYCGFGKFTGELEIWSLKGSDAWVKERSLSISSSVPSHRGFLINGTGTLGIIDKGKRFILHLQRRLPNMPFERVFFLFDLESKQAIRPLQLEDEDVIVCYETIKWFPSVYLVHPIAHVDSLVSWF